MRNFTVTAQSYTTSQRIQKVIRASSVEVAIRSVSAELDAAGFYPISAVLVA
jgi:hypothetical protein